MTSDQWGCQGLVPDAVPELFSDKPEHLERWWWDGVSLKWGRGGRHAPAGGWVLTGTVWVDFVLQSGGLGRPRGESGEDSGA